MAETGIELVLELWDHGDEATGPHDTVQLSGGRPHDHGHEEDTHGGEDDDLAALQRHGGGPGAAKDSGSHRSTGPLKQRRPWVPAAPAHAPSLLPPPSRCLDAIPTELLAHAAQHSVLNANGERPEMRKLLPPAGRSGWEVSDLFGADGNERDDTMASILAISPLVAYIPSGAQQQQVQLALSGSNLCRARCDLLARSCAGSHDVVTLLKKTTGSVNVAVQNLPSPSVLLLEACKNGVVSPSRAVLIVDSPALAAELRQLEDDPAVAAASDALLRDLGSWLEDSAARRMQLRDALMAPAAWLTRPLASSNDENADAILPHAHNQGVAGKVHALLAQQGSRTLSLCGSDRMLTLGLSILEHAVERGWCAVSTRILEEVMQLHGLPLPTIFQRAASQGLPLLHRALRSCHAQMLHTLLTWGDIHGFEWDWDRLVPTQTSTGQEVHVSALHLAAALNDSGYAGEVLLLKYARARQLWASTRDSRGFLPCQYAALAGNEHLDILASRRSRPQLLPGAPDRPLCAMRSGFGAPCGPHGPPSRVARGKRVVRKPADAHEGEADDMPGLASAAEPTPSSPYAGHPGDAADGGLWAARPLAAEQLHAHAAAAAAAGTFEGLHAAAATGVQDAANQYEPTEPRAFTDFAAARWRPFTAIWLTFHFTLLAMAGLWTAAAGGDAAAIAAHTPAAQDWQVLPLLALGLLSLSGDGGGTGRKLCFWATWATSIALRTLGTGWGWMPALANTYWPLLLGAAGGWLSSFGMEQAAFPLLFVLVAADVSPDGLHLPAALQLQHRWAPVALAFGLKACAAAAAHWLVERRHHAAARKACSGT